MYKKPKKKVAYVVFVGRVIGIHESWAECQSATDKYPGGRFKGYEVYEDGIAAWEHFEQTGEIITSVRHMAKQKKPAPKKVDPRIKERARMLVSTFTDPKTKTGQHTTSCNAVSCTYPACRCK